ncbi:hypothetical protein ACHAW6_013374 [Cyclotella cf. meneghiniana]
MDVFHKCSGYKFFTKLDISMQYYTFKLDEHSQDLCTIITPFRKYKYLRLPMGLKCSPDLAQSITESVLVNINHVDVYIDDVGAFSLDGDNNIKLLGTILCHLQENGFTMNPLKCEWAVKETDLLGYWITLWGLQHWKKKIDAILHMDHPRNASELCMFIGCVNYYQDMWPSLAHVLKPLTNYSGMEQHALIPWTPGMQTAFNKMHVLVVEDALAAYPYHNKWFDEYTDASGYQLAACLVQDGHPVVYFSHKLSKSQQNYTVMEKEMISIVATLDKF